MKKTKYLLAVIFAIIAFFACDNPPSGTISNISNTDNIELHKFYYNESGRYVFIARFKDQNKINTTTWFEQRGKQRIQCTVINIDSL